MRGAMFARYGAVTPGPSRECDITIVVEGRPKSAQQLPDSAVAARRAQSVTVPSSRVTSECRTPELRSPPPTLKKCPNDLHPENQSLPPPITNQSSERYGKHRNNYIHKIVFCGINL